MQKIDIRFKKGVDPTGCTVDNIRAMVIVAPIFASYGHILTITSMREGNHMEGSLHVRGGLNRAFDARSRDEIEDGGKKWGFSKRCIMANEFRQALGKHYDVVVESTHFHIEFDEKS